MLRNFLIKGIFVIATIVCVFMVIFLIELNEVNVKGTLYIIPEYSDTYYVPISDNSGYTNINGVSNVYHNLRKEGFIIYKEDVKEKEIDVIFEKDTKYYRFYFQYPENQITYFSSEYENSFLLNSYIIERK